MAKEKMKFNFGQEVLVLPRAVLDHIGKASESDLRVLLTLGADPSLADSPARLARACGCDREEVEAALGRWAERGVLSGEAIPVMAEPAAEEAPAEGKKEKEKEKKSKKTAVRHADELPNYTSDELSDWLETHKHTRELIDEAQHIVGKVFNVSEVNIIIGLSDYLGLCNESILLILAHAKEIGRTNLRSIEKMAFALSERELVSPIQLEEEFRRQDEMHTFEGEVRSIFGMKSRSLTSKEGKMLEAWHSFGYGADIVRLAYEITINATGEPSVPYTNSILERWHSLGLQTIEDVTKRHEEEKAKKQENPPAGGNNLGNSFDTDDFFEAALRRTFRERRED